MRFFDSKEARAEAKLAKSHDEMVEKLNAKHLTATWQNEAASYQSSGGGGRAADRAFVTDIVYEQPTIMDRPQRGRRSLDPDGVPVRGPSGRPVYKPERVFDLRGVFGANRRTASGDYPRERWPEHTQPRVEGPAAKGNGCTIPGCTC